MPEITTDINSFESIDYPKNIYELLLSLQKQPIEINLNETTPSTVLHYTTQEQPTGENWLDGKPIYRKGYIGSLNDGELFIDLNFVLIFENLISAKGYLKKTDSNPHFLHEKSSLYYAHFMCDPSEFLQWGLITNSTSQYSSCFYAISLEYTKRDVPLPYLP